MAKKTNQTPAKATGAQPVKPAANNAKQQPGGIKKPQAARATNSDQNSDAGFLGKYTNILIPVVIGLVTYLFLQTCTNNKLTNWDDLGYIITDPTIKNTSAEGIKRILGFDGIPAASVMGNYHPFTILLYAIEYSYYGLEPWIYHFDSVLLQVLITIAVYYFVKLFTGRTVAAGITALLFGLHPMHVESVAWAAGRKDILYGLFFVLTCTTWIKYIRGSGKQKTYWYIAGIVLFALSLLAKSVGVTLPVTLFLLDYFEGRPLWVYGTENKKNLNFMLVVEKLPHFGLALLFGLISVFAQKDIGALGSLDANFNPLERIALGCYALWNYLWKAVLPLGLSNFYPYPLKVGDSLPAVYYIYPAIILAIGFLVWRFGRKNKMVIFGLGFFLINIVLLLQFIPVGGAIMSDRYGYIPYLGLFMILGWFVSGYFEDKAKLPVGKILLGVTLAYCLVLGYLANERCKDWYDSISLWKDDAEKHPEGPVAYFYLGQEYFTRYEAAASAKEKQMDGDSSMYYFNMSVARKPDYINPIICIAELQRNYNQNDAAEQTYYKAMKISDKNESVYLGLGVIHTIKGTERLRSLRIPMDSFRLDPIARQELDSARFCFQAGIKLKAYFPEGYSNFANYLDIMGKTDSALLEYANAIEQNPDAYIPYMNRARIYLLQVKNYDKAIADYNKAIMLKPEMAEPYYLRGRAYLAKGNKTSALQDVEKAKTMGYPVDPAIYNDLKRS